MAVMVAGIDVDGVDFEGPAGGNTGRVAMEDQDGEKFEGPAG